MTIGNVLGCSYFHVISRTRSNLFGEYSVESYLICIRSDGGQRSSKLGSRCDLRCAPASEVITRTPRSFGKINRVCLSLRNILLDGKVRTGSLELNRAPSLCDYFLSIYSDLLRCRIISDCDIHHLAFCNRETYIVALCPESNTCRACISTTNIPIPCSVSDLELMITGSYIVEGNGIAFVQCDVLPILSGQGFATCDVILHLASLYSKHIHLAGLGKSFPYITLAFINNNVNRLVCITTKIIMENHFSINRNIDSIPIAILGELFARPCAIVLGCCFIDLIISKGISIYILPINRSEEAYGYFFVNCNIHLCPNIELASIVIESRITDNINIGILSSCYAVLACIESKCICAVRDLTIAVVVADSISYINTYNLDTLALVGSKISIQFSNRQSSYRNLCISHFCCPRLSLHCGDFKLALICSCSNLILTIQFVTCCVAMTTEINQRTCCCILNKCIVSINKSYDCISQVKQI